MKEMDIEGAENEELKVWLHLHPGDIDKDLVRFNCALNQNFPNEKTRVTKCEYVKYVGLLHAARFFTQRGVRSGTRRAREFTTPPTSAGTASRTPAFRS